jgi:hypothetical protein
MINIINSIILRLIIFFLELGKIISVWIRLSFDTSQKLVLLL